MQWGKNVGILYAKLIWQFLIELKAFIYLTVGIFALLQTQLNETNRWKNIYLWGIKEKNNKTKTFALYLYIYLYLLLTHYWSIIQTCHLEQVVEHYNVTLCPNCWWHYFLRWTKLQQICFIVVLGGWAAAGQTPSWYSDAPGTSG